MRQYDKNNDKTVGNQFNITLIVNTIDIKTKDINCNKRQGNIHEEYLILFIIYCLLSNYKTKSKRCFCNKDDLSV